MVGYIGFDPGANSSVTRLVTSTVPTTPVTYANTDIGSTSLYLPFNDDIQDDSPFSQTITNRGSMTVDSTNPKFGSNALKSQTSGSLKIDNSASMDLDGPFTVEFFFHTTASLSQLALYTHNEITTNYSGLLFWIANDNTLRLYASANGSSWNIFQNPQTLANISRNVWHHVAITYDGSTYRAYYDGTRKFEVNSSTTLPTGGHSYILSRNNSGQYQAATGKVYIDDFRIVKGVALYTDSTYIVPTSALGINSGTHPVSLYLPFDDNTDDATNAYTISGTASVSSAQAKFGGASALFNSGTTHLTASDSQSAMAFTGAFTIEMWVYQTASPSGSGYTLVGAHNSSGWLLQLKPTLTRFYVTGSIIASFNETLTNDTWHHLAVVREEAAGVVKFYLNGTLKATSGSTPSTMPTNRDLFIGAYRSGSSSQNFQGYIDDLRIIDGLARYTKNFVPPSQAVGGTLNGENETNTTTDFTTLYLPFDSDIQDDSDKAHSMTATGNAAISSAQSKFGGNSLATDGTGDRLEFTYDTNSYFGTGDFTVEAWVWITGYSGSYYTVVSLGQPGATSSYQPKFLLNVEGSGSKVRSIIAGTYINHSDAISGSFPTGEWVHLAATRENGVYRTFINGVLNGSTTNSSDVTSDSGTSTIGGASYGSGSGTAYSNNGYIDDLRILKGYAKYTGDFLPPTSAVGASVSETVNDLSVLYLPFDTTVTSGSSAASSLYLPFDSGYGTDDQSSYGHTVTVSGNATTDNVVTPVTGYNGAASRSGYFDGNDDYLTVANHSSLVFGSDDFTVEGFFYAQSVGSDGLIGMWEDNQRQWLISFASGKLYAAYSTNGTSATSLNSGVTISTGQTYHFAFTRQGSTFRLFVDGVLKTTSTYSGSLHNTTGALHVGSNGDNLGSLEFNGYLDDLRVTKGTAIYTENFSVPTAAVGPTGTPITTSGGFEDQARNHGVIKNGDVRLSTSVKKFGISSAYFDGTGDYLSLTHGYQIAPGDFSYEDDDFTIEAWVYLTSYNSQGSMIISRDREQTEKRGWRFGIESNGKLNFTYTTDADRNSRISTSTNGTVSLNTWTHVAFTRQADVGRFFINGTVDSITRNFNGNSIYDPAVSEVLVGARDSGTNANFSGYIDDLRVIKGHARYTETFTPSTSALGYEIQTGGGVTTSAVVDKKELGSVWTLNRGSGQARGKSFINLRKRGRWRKSKLKTNEGHRYREGTTESKVAYYAFTSPGTIDTSDWTNINRVDYLGVTAGGSGTTGGNRNWSPGSAGDSGTITAHLNQPGSSSSPISITVGSTFPQTIDGPESAPDSPLTIPSAVQSAFNHYNITGGAAGAQGAGAKGGGPGGGGTPTPANGPGGAGGVSFAVLTSSHPDWTNHNTLTTPEIPAVTASLGSPGSSAPHPGSGSYNSGGKGGGGGVGYGAGGGAGAGGAPPGPASPGPQGGSGAGGAGGAGSPGITLVRVQGTVFTAVGGDGFSTSGGTEITSGGYKYHVFTSPGTFTMSGGTKDLEYLVVAGGGGGGGANASHTGAGGGGGAGGLRQGTLPAVAVGSYPVTVGTGGAGTNTQGTAGNNSVFSTITAYGGGAGGSGRPQQAGGAGGSGGGGGGDESPRSGGSASPGDGGNPGGSSAGPSGDQAGGGGGAGSAGGSAVMNPGESRRGGAGGAGSPYPAYAGPIIAPAIPSTTQDAIGPTGLYSGGGGGSTNQTPPGGHGGGPGGPGGGGRGNSPLNTQYGRGEDGVDGTGGGGGGANHQTSPRTGGDGGDGIVIIRYSIS